MEGAPTRPRDPGTESLACTMRSHSIDVCATEFPAPGAGSCSTFTCSTRFAPSPRDLSWGYIHISFAG